RATRDPGIVAGFLKEFATSADGIPRTLFSVIIFAYCWTRAWSAAKNDVRVSEAYDRAAGIIISRFKDAKLVRVSDYVVSESELSTFFFDLYKHFGQRIPVSVDPNADIEIINKAYSEATRSYQIPFEILTKTIMLMRNEQMTQQISDCVAANLNVPDTLMILSGTLYEQISGVTVIEL